MIEQFGTCRSPVGREELEQWFQTARRSGERCMILCHDRQGGCDYALPLNNLPLDEVMKSLEGMRRCRVLRVFLTGKPFDEQYEAEP